MRPAFLAVALLACNHTDNPPAQGSPDAASAPDGSGGRDAATSPDDAAVMGDGPAAPTDAGPAADRGVEQDYDDLAQALAAVARAPQLIAMQDGVNLGYNASLPGFTLVQPGEVQGTRDGVSYDYLFHCEDQQAQDNYTCGPQSDHIHVYATINGPFTIDQLSMSELKLTTAWTIREIYLNKPQVEGTAKFLVTATLANTGTHFKLTISGTNYDHVRLDPTPALPFGGGVTYSITAHRDRATATPSARDFTAAATITFAAHSLASIGIDATHTYSLDMSSGVMTKM